MVFNKYIINADSLVTSHEQTRSGFISFALEKNRKSTPYIEQAKVLKQFALKAKTPKELLLIAEIQNSLLSAAGLSDKSLKYFNEDDKKEAINQLIDNFLEPAGESFVDEVVYRFLLTKGDALGGTMRNIVGVLGEQKLKRNLLAILSVSGINYQWYSLNDKRWHQKPNDETIVEENAKAIYWSNKTGNRVLGLNLKVPVVNKNVDICVFDCDAEGYKSGKIVTQVKKTIMLGELKGGIDPAGADEHWKTANSALQRIRTSFETANHSIHTSFIGAAIERSMATEIYSQLCTRTLSNAANLSCEEQVTEYCNWIINI